MPNLNDAITALDKVITKSRVHFYKPIQIAEILFHHRQGANIRLENVETYRNLSKKWRDDVSGRLVGRRSTSSQKYQDDLFNSNAMPPQLLALLGEENNRTGGSIEAYIYHSILDKLSAVRVIAEYINSATPETFSLVELLSYFKRYPGLKRSIDKAYEIIVYALFDTLVRAFKATVTLEIEDNPRLINDFEGFVRIFLSLDKNNTKISMPASLYRVGVTNAADSGIDIWANFGPAIQVKHLTLSLEDIDDIAEGIECDRIIVVCIDSEKPAISSLLKQIGYHSRVQGIITLTELKTWYGVAMSEIYSATLGVDLLLDLRREFTNEFPSSVEIEPFIQQRNYRDPRKR